jgi:hypothetical protein
MRFDTAGGSSLWLELLDPAAHHAPRDMEGLWRSLRVKPRAELLIGIESSETSGEIFADGSMIELVSSATDNQLDLLFWNKHRKIIASQIEYRDRVYQAPDVDETLRRAIRLPKHEADYGTTKKLFAEIRILFERYVGLTLPESSLMSAWVCSTWFPD